jgi:hypothetical protein
MRLIEGRAVLCVPPPHSERILCHLLFASRMNEASHYSARAASSRWAVPWSFRRSGMMHHRAGVVHGFRELHPPAAPVAGRTLGPVHQRHHGARRPRVLQTLGAIIKASRRIVCIIGSMLGAIESRRNPVAGDACAARAFDARGESAIPRGRLSGLPAAGLGHLLVLISAR